MFTKILFVAAISVCWMEAQASLIFNGDFATDAAGWTYNNEGVDGGYLSAEGNSAGSFWVNHNGTNVSGDPDPMLSQEISTVSGIKYQLTFDYSGRVITGSPDGFAVDINGLEVATFLISGTDWLSESLEFTAFGANTLIAFRSEINGTDFDARVDNVSVGESTDGPAPVPEPSIFALMVFGLAGIGYSRHRRKKAA